MESLALKSKTSETFVAMPNGARRQLLLDRVLRLLVFTLVAFAPVCLEAQAVHPRKNPGAAAAKSQVSKPQSQNPQIVFDYYPTPMSLSFKESEYVFVAIAKGGRAQAVRYGPYNPAIIAVYDGNLTKADVARLIARSQSAIPKASALSTNVACDSDQFALSLNGPKSQISMSDSACLLRMPDEIFNLVDEMRTLWKRLEESSLAYAYVRSFQLKKDLLSRHQTAKQFISIRRFPRRLRAIVRNANNGSPKFYPLERDEFEQLKALGSDPSQYFVIDHGIRYYLTLFLSRNTSPASLKGVRVTL